MEYVAERKSTAFIFVPDMQVFKIFFCYSSNIDSLFEALESEHHSNEWRLFIDSNKASLKAVLLNNGNEKPSISLVHAHCTQRNPQAMKLILRLINYAVYKWNIYGELKVIRLLDLQMVYTKNQCFLYLCDSHDDKQHYIKKDWPLRETFVPGRFNIHHVLLADAKKINLQPMHIKLRLFKNFDKASNKSGW